MTSLVCIELPEQIKLALKVLSQRGISDYEILALTPHVEYALEKLGLAYERPEDYHTEDDINNIGFDNLATQKKFNDMVDSFLQSRWEILNEYKIHPADLNWYYLKKILNAVSIPAFILRRVFEHKQPELVYYFGTRDESINRDLRFLGESVWSKVIQAALGSFEIPGFVIANNSDPRVLSRYQSIQPWNFRVTMKKIALRAFGPAGIRFMRNGMRNTKLFGSLFTALIRKKEIQRLPRVLFLDSNFNLAYLQASIEAKKSFSVLRWAVHPMEFPYYINQPALTKSTLSKAGYSTKHHFSDLCRQMGDDICSRNEFRSFFQFSGIDCYSILERRLRHFFDFSLPDLVNIYLNARVLLKSENPFAVMTSTLGDYGDQTVALAARHENTPFVIYRHGDSSGHIQMRSGVAVTIKNMDLNQPDYVLAFGEGDVEFLETGKRDHVKIIPIGSASLDKLKRPKSKQDGHALRKKYGLSTTKKLVMYVPTDMEGNMRISPHRSRSPSRSYELERALLRTFSEFPDVQFVLKLHITHGHPCSPIVQEIRDLGVKNCVTITDPFSLLIPMADMFITDYPSTSFLEMQTTDKPILVCGHQLPIPMSANWDPSLLDIWQERIAYSDDLEEFTNLLRDYLKNNRFQPVKSENAILKLFGTHLDDGRSVNRAHDFLVSLERSERSKQLEVAETR